MTESTDTREGRRVLRVYRLYRARFTPYTAMHLTQDHFAWLTVYSVQGLALNTAAADARCFSVADKYRGDIDKRSLRMPYWLTGTISKPIPPEVIDYCLVCGIPDTGHNDALRLHAFRSSL